MPLELKYFPDPILYSHCEKVRDISRNFVARVKQMEAFLDTLPGLALAAPQVGFSERIIVINMMKTLAREETLILINPIINDSFGKSKLEEGCLSVPDVFEKVARPEKIEVRGLDLNGKDISFEADDILARIVQHEMDHLDGILFWDHLSERKRKKLQAKFLKSHRIA